MRILADENIESEIVAALRDAGHDVSDVKELAPGAEDSDVLRLAREADTVLLTNDKDFGELIYRNKLLSKGVILLRFGSLEIAEKIDLLKDVLKERATELPEVFTVITPTGVRVRK